MAKKLVPVAGIRLKFRTDDRKGKRTATATIWVDDAPLREIATLDLCLVERPGDPIYQGWVDAISAAFHKLLSSALGIEGITGKRQAPRYRGEGRGPTP